MNRPALTSETTAASGPKIYRDVSTIPVSVSWRVGGFQRAKRADVRQCLWAFPFDDLARLGNGHPAIASVFDTPGLWDWEELRSADKLEVVLRVDDPDLVWQWLQQHCWHWVVHQPLVHVRYDWKHFPSTQDWAGGGLTTKQGQTRALANILAGGQSANWQEYLPIAKPETRSALIMSYAEAWQDEIFALIRDGLNVSERYSGHTKWGTTVGGIPVGDMFEYVPDRRGAPFMGFERALAYLRADVRPEEAIQLESGEPVARPTDSALEALAALR